MFFIFYDNYNQFTTHHFLFVIIKNKASHILSLSNQLINIHVESTPQFYYFFPLLVPTATHLRNFKFDVETVYKTFGDNIPQEVQNLIKAKFKKGLHKPIKIALVACEDIHLYELEKKARNVEREIESSSLSSSSDSSDSSSKSNSDSKSDNNKSKSKKSSRSSKKNKMQKETSRDISILKKLLSNFVISQPADQSPTEPTKPQHPFSTYI